MLSLGRITRRFKRLTSVGVLCSAQSLYDLVLPRRLRCLSAVTPCIHERRGLEIGGPSPIFGRSGNIPVYDLAGEIDNCTFSSVTVWEGSVLGGRSFRFARDRTPGHQFITEATDLSALASESYDFVLSSHCIEHVANPIKALYEWMRVLRPGGLLILVAPDKSRTFDRRRPVTTLEHMKHDFSEGTTEADQTHVEEILSLHDYDLDWASEGPHEFRVRAQKNLENRCLHHHVFDADLIKELAGHVGLEVIDVEMLRPCHIALVGRKRGLPSA